MYEIIKLNPQKGLIIVKDLQTDEFEVKTHEDLKLDQKTYSDLVNKYFKYSRVGQVVFDLVAHEVYVKEFEDRPVSSSFTSSVDEEFKNQLMKLKLWKN